MDAQKGDSLSIPSHNPQSELGYDPALSSTFTSSMNHSRIVGFIFLP